MRFPSIFAVSAYLTMVLAVALPEPAPQAGGGTCFDAGDCILSGGGECVKDPGQIVGTCAAAPSSPGFGLPSFTLPSFPGATTTEHSQPAASPTGNICFDDGDCFFMGGKCVKKSATEITGNCSS
ncbi:hypothetical protein DL98DRAFT_533899 [Cadophora sp. DSE1049]|nr:hypothetical protein DL98DRAFT_533899 [Cadophora sp. DSE1049]